MTDSNFQEITTDFSTLNLSSTPNNNNDLETAEEVCGSDSQHNYLAGSYRCERFEYLTPHNSNLAITPHSIPDSKRNSMIRSNSSNGNNNLQIPIVGYEVMEERARFTVYKLRIENKTSGDCWYVFRRYTDFVRLCTRLKRSYPTLTILMPRKKWFGNNFDPSFLEERIQGLQAFINALISIPELVNNQQIRDFFCLNEPPVYSDTTEESRAIFEALEDTICHLRFQLRDKESTIDQLQSTLDKQILENDQLKMFLRNSTDKCQKCQKDYDNFQKVHHTNFDENIMETVPLSFTSSNTKG